MRRVRAQPQEARRIGERARAEIARTLSPVATGAAMRARLEELDSAPRSARALLGDAGLLALPPAVRRRQPAQRPVMNGVGVGERLVTALGFGPAVWIEEPRGENCDGGPLLEDQAEQ